MHRSGRRDGLRRRHPPLLHLLPNIITIAGLCAGMTSIRYALDARWELAASLLVAAAVLDGLDGRSARMLNLTSKLGAQLDSLADFLSFGVAPAVLVYLWSLHEVRGVGWALAMLFATCCALRLARFNTEIDLPDRPRWASYFFTGIPAPAAAGLAITPLMWSFVVGEGVTTGWTVNAIMFVFVAFMMVSRVPTFSAKRVRVKPEQVLPVLLFASVLIVGLITETWATFCIIAALYIASIPVGIWQATKMRRADPGPTPVAAGDQRVVAIEGRQQRPG
ncbi:MAG: CDP-diacylglycerol--serine O-phosphatidyltransferase [Geminicoccaceae bacterium]